MGTERETVIVTGSSGLIGSAAVRRLAERFRVVGFDRDGPRTRRPRPSASTSISAPTRASGPPSTGPAARPPEEGTYAG